MTAGAGGLVVSAFLPSKWTKPVVNLGVSPVHAQASITVGTIKGTTSFVRQNGGKPQDANLPGSWVVVGPMQDCEITVDGYPSLTSTSDKSGAYSISNVPVGNRTITCVPPRSYYFPIDPASADNVPETVNGITDTVQDFNFEDRG
jgi:hypothetical protein